MKSAYSTKIRYICLIEGQGAIRYQDSVYILQAESFNAAFNKAIEVARSHEKSHTNSDGKVVMWKAKDIVSLDCIGDKVIDGSEVYSEPVNIECGTAYPFDAEFKIENSHPTQTI